MSSFLLLGEQEEWEIEAVRNAMAHNWKSAIKYQMSYLDAMAFPTLLPDGKGDTTNQGLLRDISLQ